ncbi:MAG: bifunctional lysylphosphatidylglycerol flippase/synthetase MprF [Thermoleophilaceae bacterium]
MAASRTRALAAPAIAAVIFLTIGVRLIANGGDDLAAAADGTPWAKPERRGIRGAPWLVPGAGLLAAAAGIANVVSALTPELSGRLTALERLAPSELVLAAHAAALPAGLALLALSIYLARGRRRALWLAVGLLTALGALDLLKGLDFEEAAVSWLVAGVLVWGRDAFTVRHEDGTIATALLRAVLLAATAVTVTFMGVVAVAHWSVPGLTAGRAVRETFDLLILSAGPEHFGEAFRWLPVGVGLMSVGSLLVGAWVLFRPLRSRHPAPAREHALARGVVGSHGSDTLSAFKLRGDLHKLWSTDHRAFLSYRIEQGVLLVAGDPVGPVDAQADLMSRLEAFAAERGLPIGAVCASEPYARRARGHGLKALYIGDEALVRTHAFSLEGRSKRKLRQGVNRVGRAGVTVDLRPLEHLTPAELAQLESMSQRWRAGASEHGFSMSMDSLANHQVAGSLVVIARDTRADALGFLHFVPVYGTSMMSLSAMRRDPAAPNGLTEFLVVRALALLDARGVEEVSLNFAAFAAWMHAPADRLERLLARLLRRADDYFQVESLYRFNAKFVPRWQPRYLLYESLPALPRTALAALLAEGQIPKPRLPARREAVPVPVPGLVA